MKKSILFIALISSLTTFAQAPERMSFQAVIRDAGDLLLTNTTIGVQVSILEGSSTGTAVYIETHTPTTNDNGLVTLEIGGGAVVIGDFTTIDWGSDAHFIKTETDPTGGTTYTIEGTTELLSVPYALYSNATAALGNTLDQAYDQEGNGTPSTRTITADDGKIEIVASGNKALELTADPAFTGLGITSAGGDGISLDITGPGSLGEAIDISTDAAGNALSVLHTGTGVGMEILSTNPANATDALEITYSGTSDGLSLTSGGGADGIDVTYSGTAEAIQSVLLAGTTGNGMKVLNMGAGDGIYVDNTFGTGDDSVQIDHTALGDALELNIFPAATGNGLVVNNDGLASVAVDIKNTNLAAALAALKIDNAGLGNGIELFNGNPVNLSEALKITQAGAGTGLLIDNGGVGKGLHVFNGAPGNVDLTLLANTMGLGTVAMLSTDDNNTNVSSTLVGNNLGAGSVAEFITIDEPVGKVNDKPTVNVVSNGKGIGVNIDVINDLVGSDGNLEPALFVRHMGLGTAGYFITPPSAGAAHNVEILNGGAGNGLHIDCIGSTTGFIDNALHVEQSNISAFTSSGYAALFELHPAGTTADAAVKITSAATAGGSSALRVIPADPTKLAAVFEGNVEVASDITIGGMMSAAAKAFKIDHPLDPENKFLVHNSIESNERVNIYSGNITTNSSGYATVRLPEYMCALNRDFKYQLTVVDKSFARAIIWETVDTETNSFVIKTDTPNISVSWQITGTRHDTWALENPMQVEIEKTSQY